MRVSSRALYSITVTKTLQKFITGLRNYWPLILVTVFFSLFYITYINLFNSDLGRHITNGREILSGQTAMLTTNYYSYTQTEFNFINHHWLFGVFVYLINQLGGFTLLTVSTVVLHTVAFGFILATALRNTTLQAVAQKETLRKSSIVAVLSFLCLPLFVHRTEVRPESISLLFFAVYYFLFNGFSNHNTDQIFQKKWLIVSLLLLQVIWVNTHLFFILGPLLAGYFLFTRVLQVIAAHRNPLTDSSFLFWITLTGLLFLVSVLNPNGLVGLLAPLNIFNNYAYRVAENQSTLFMIQYGAQVPLHLYTLTLSIGTGIFSLLLLLKKRRNLIQTLPNILLVGIFIFLANKINRMSPFLGVVIIPFFAQYTLEEITRFWEKKKQLLDNSFILMSFSTILFMSVVSILRIGIFTPQLYSMGSGLIPQTHLAANFFLENKLTGPIFNNYDLGGYLTYTLFPKEKLFIDNRPEAYSSVFLETQYLAALQNETTWQEISQQYNINTIFFYRHDQIDGAQQFLYHRIIDEDWIPVFVDTYTIIFVKNTQINKEIIEKHRLPQELFSIN